MLTDFLAPLLCRLKCSLAVFAVRHRQLLLLTVFAIVASVAVPIHANAAVDFSDITNQWSSIKTFLIFVGSAISVGCLIVSIVKFIGRDWGEALMWIAGAAGMGFVVAHAAGWIGSETGATLYAKHVKETTPLNDSLNASKLRWGLPLPVVITILAMAGLVGWLYSTLIAVVLVVGVPFASSRLVALDRNIYRLVALSLHQKAHYYPGRKRS